MILNEDGSILTNPFRYKNKTNRVRTIDAFFGVFVLFVIVFAPVLVPVLLTEA